MKARAQAGRRGRPPKFGRPGHLVAVTLPEEVVRGLRRIDRDLAWAIVRVFEGRGHAPANGSPAAATAAELVTVGQRQSLIVVDRLAFKGLQGVRVIPLLGDRAFLALEPGRGIADLELAVVDRLSQPELDGRERATLADFRTRLRRWRRDRRLRWTTQSIIVGARVRTPRATTRIRSMPPQAAAGSRRRSSPSSFQD